jgi:hypothetical protein
MLVYEGGYTTATRRCDCNRNVVVNGMRATLLEIFRYEYTKFVTVITLLPLR